MGFPQTIQITHLVIPAGEATTPSTSPIRGLFYLHHNVAKIINKSSTIVFFPKNKFREAGNDKNRFGDGFRDGIDIVELKLSHSSYSNIALNSKPYSKRL
jgi:hypothetical protein